MRPVGECERVRIKKKPGGKAGLCAGEEENLRRARLGILLMLGAGRHDCHALNVTRGAAVSSREDERV